MACIKFKNLTELELTIVKMSGIIIVAVQCILNAVYNVAVRNLN